MNRSLVFAMMVVVFAGVFLAPGGPLDGIEGKAAETDAEAAANSFAADPPDTQSRIQANALGANSVWSGGDTVLQREPDGHFYANARVDGRPLRFLVDTGASVIALTGSDARTLGIHWSQSDIRPIGQGASGEVLGVPVILERVELDDHRADRVSAVVIPEGLHISLLGQSFLGAIPKVSIEGQTMVMGR